MAIFLADFCQLLYGSTGVVYVGQKSGDSFNEKRYNTKNIINNIASLDLNRDSYISINSFRRAGARSNADAYQLNALYCDLDLKLTAYDDTVTLAEDLGKELATKNIPTYSMLVDSGHGLHVYWLLKATYANNAKVAGLYNAINRTLNQLLAKLGADSSATDMARYLRLPQSLNLKDGDVKRVEVIDLDDNEVRYDLSDFRHLLPVLKPKQQVKKGNNARYKIKIKTTQLNLDRQHDLEKVVSMRDGKLDGYRHTLLLNYGLAYGDIRALNNQLANPLPTADIGYLINYVTNNGKGMASGDKLTRQLNLTPEEYGQLKVIKPKAVALNNHRKRVTIANIKRVIATLIKYKKYIYVQKSRKSNSQIANDLGIKKRRVQVMRNEMQETELVNTMLTTINDFLGDLLENGVPKNVDIELINSIQAKCQRINENVKQQELLSDITDLNRLKAII